MLQNRPSATPQDDPQKRRPDMSEAERVLAWRPAISLREGLIKTIPYFEQLVAKAVAPPELRRRAVGSLMIDSEGGHQ